MSKCPICGAKMGMFEKKKIQDGYVCGLCIRISSNWRAESISNFQRYWSENDERLSMFEPTQTLKSLMSEAITVDDVHRFFVFGKFKKLKIKPIVYSYHEVEGYSYQKQGEKTIIKKKGGIGRALVGGALAGPAGAIVGASTSKQETVTQGGVNVLNIEMKIVSGAKTIVMSNPPLGFTNFLDRCIDMEKGLRQTTSGADEIRKYKSLLDEGIITQKEYENKKKQLLDL